MTEQLSHIIRRKFVEYFMNRHGHKFIRSSSVIPRGDTTLSFVNAGMNQFKSHFLAEQSVYDPSRVCNYQKCIRVGGKMCDLEDVGNDHRHHTFFEMLGNWSFNDYGKIEACEWALEYLVSHMKLDQSKMVVTYHKGTDDVDNETCDTWKRLGFEQTQIKANQEGDNFWEMGESGPCGMSTELFYHCGQEGLIEIWNLVFIDRVREGLSGKIKPLKGKFVDTGMGFERLMTILEGVESNYDTELFRDHFQAIKSKSNVAPYGGRLDSDLDRQYRTLADHSRMITVALADGVKPGRKGASFDLRSIIKKALTILRDAFGQEQPRYLLFDLVDATIKSLGPAYPELADGATVKHIRRTLAHESRRYLNYLDNRVDGGTHEQAPMTTTPSFNTTKTSATTERYTDHAPALSSTISGKLDEVNGKIIRLRNMKQVHKMIEQCRSPKGSCNVITGEVGGIAMDSRTNDHRLPLGDYIISGRVCNFRTYKRFNFVDLLDGSCNQHLQLIIDRQLLNKVDLGSYVSCSGNFVVSKGNQQAYEFKVKKLEYLGECDPESYPLVNDTKPRELAFPVRTDSNIHLRVRTNSFVSLLRARSELELSLHMIMKQMDFFRVPTPCLTSNDSEASSDLFLLNRTKKRSNGLDHAENDNNNHNNNNTTHIQDIEGLKGERLDGWFDRLVAGELSDNEERLGRKGKEVEIKTNIKQDDNKASTPADNNPGREKANNTTLASRRLDERYFGKNVFLSTSGQLHLESLAAGLGRVYTLSSGFRAENSISRRHLCEFQMLEAEEANVFETSKLMDRVESIVKFGAQFLLQVSEHRDDTARLLQSKQGASANLERLLKEPFIRMTYDDVSALLLRLRQQPRRSETSGALKTDSISHKEGGDIGRPDEVALLEETEGVPVFITNYPKHLKPFYMKSHPEREDRVLCFDLIAPFGGEICGGSLREDSYDKLLANLGYNTNSKQHHHFDWYLDLRRFGSFPHGGFGIGIERLIQSLLSIENIRDTTPFPRWPGHCPM